MSFAKQTQNLLSRALPPDYREKPMNVIRLVGVAALAATLIFASLDSVAAQDDRTAAGIHSTLGAILQSGAFPAKTEKDARVLQGVGAFNTALGTHYENQSRNNAIRQSGPQIHVHNHVPNQTVGTQNQKSGQSTQQNTGTQHHPATASLKQSSFQQQNSGNQHTNALPGSDPSKPFAFVCSYFQDFNDNGTIDLFELIGKNKQIFTRNGAINLGIWLPVTGIKGKTVTFELYNPQGKAIETHAYSFPKDNDIHGYDCRDLVQKNGQGSYVAVFRFEGKHFATIPFEVIE